MGLHEFVETAAPPLTRAEEIYLQSLTELARSLTGKLPLPLPLLVLTLVMWLLTCRRRHLAMSPHALNNSLSSVICLEHGGASVRGCCSVAYSDGQDLTLCENSRV